MSCCPAPWTFGAAAQVALGAEDEAICLPHLPEDASVVHGYGHPAMHNASALGPECRQGAVRCRGADLVAPAVEVGAIRISAPGWEGWVLDGLQVRAGCAVRHPMLLCTKQA